MIRSFSRLLFSRNQFSFKILLAFKGRRNKFNGDIWTEFFFSEERPRVKKRKKRNRVFFKKKVKNSKMKKNQRENRVARVKIHEAYFFKAKERSKAGSFFLKQKTSYSIEERGF